MSLFIEEKILSLLSFNAGESTAQIAHSVRPMLAPSTRGHSAKIGTVLRSMERRGLVLRMDEQAPVVWIKSDVDHGRATDEG